MDVFIAYNSKKQVLISGVLAFMLFILSGFLMVIRIEAAIIPVLTGLFCVGFSLHYFFQPETAIRATDKEIFFYKGKKIFTYRIEDLSKVCINITTFSFDTRIYTKSEKKKGFHFLIVDSYRKRDEYIRYLKYRGVKVETVTSWFD